MIKLKGVYISAPVSEIIQTVSGELGLFKDIRYGATDIMVTCPFHDGGNENTPSMGIVTENKPGVEAGLSHCFACSWTGDFSKLIEPFIPDTFVNGEEWLAKRFGTDYLPTRELKFGSRSIPERPQYVSPHFLEQFDTYHAYLKNRGISQSVASLFDVRVDAVRGNILFPVKDAEGNILYIAHRNMHEKRFHIPVGVKKGLYGVYELTKGRIGSNDLIVCEGVFDAMSATEFGAHSIALLGTGSKEQFELVKQLLPRHIILAFDGDHAGAIATVRAYEHLSGHKMISQLVVPEGKDLNDLTYEEFHSLPLRRM